MLKMADLHRLRINHLDCFTFDRHCLIGTNEFGMKTTKKFVRLFVNGVVPDGF